MAAGSSWRHARLRVASRRRSTPRTISIRPALPRQVAEVHPAAEASHGVADPRWKAEQQHSDLTRGIERGESPVSGTTRREKAEAPLGDKRGFLADTGETG